MADDVIERLSGEDRATLERIQQQVNDAQTMLAELMRGWNHGPKLMASANRLYTQLDDARAATERLI